MFVFRTIWRALFSCETRFKIQSFALSVLGVPIFNILCINVAFVSEINIKCLLKRFVQSVLFNFDVKLAKVW